MNEQVDTETIVNGIRTGRQTRSGNRYHAEDGRFDKRIEAYDKLLDTLIPKNISYFKKEGLIEPQYLVGKNIVEAGSFNIEDSTIQSQMAHELSHVIDHLNNLPSRLNNELSLSIRDEGTNPRTMMKILEIDVEHNRDKIHELIRKICIDEYGEKYRYNIEAFINQQIKAYDKKHPDRSEFSEEEKEELKSYRRLKDALKSADPDFFAYLDNSEPGHNSKYWKSDENNKPQEFFANVAASFFSGDEKTLELYERFFPKSLSIVEKRMTDLLPTNEEEDEAQAMKFYGLSNGGNTNEN